MTVFSSIQGEFQIKPSASQGNSFVIGLTDGKYVIARTDSFIGAKAQVYDASGRTVTGDILLKDFSTGYTSLTDITPLTGGKFIVIWNEHNYSAPAGSSVLNAQIFNSDGTSYGSQISLATITSGDKRSFHTTSLANGGFAVTWEDYSGTLGGNSSGAIHVQIYNSQGTPAGNEFIANSQFNAPQREPAIASLSDGNFVVCWRDTNASQSTPSSSIKAQVISPNGTKIGPELLVNSDFNFSQEIPSVTGLSGGGFAVSWTTFYSNGSHGDIKAQIFGSDGTKIGSEVLVNAVSTGDQRSSTMSGLANGGFIVAWQEDGNFPGGNNAMNAKVQIFNADGSRFGSEFTVSSEPGDPGNKSIFPSVAGLSGGGFVLTWMNLGLSNGNIPNARAEQFSQDAASLTGGGADDWVIGNGTNDLLIGGGGNDIIDGGAGFDTLGFAGNYSDYAFAALGNGTFQVQDNRSGSPDGFDTVSNIELLRFADRDVLVSALMGVVMKGTPSSDALTGGSFDDQLNGFAGNDILSGMGGNDLLNGGLGSDILDGGLGNDTASYADAALAIRVSLAITKAQNTAGAGYDTLINIENLEGSAFADRLTGNAGANVLTGNAGNDTLDGGGGADVLKGGIGNDTYMVDDIADQVVENAGEGTDTVKSSVTFALAADIEKLLLTGASNIDGTGNGLANTLTGNSGNNVLTGGLGKDVLSGGAGNDTLIGGMGADRLTGGLGNDTFVFDVLETRLNKDTITDFVSGQDHIALSRSAFTAFAGDLAGALDPAAFVIGTSAMTSTEHLIYNSGSGALFYDADGLGGTAQVQIAQMTGLPTLTAADFILM